MPVKYMVFRRDKTFDTPLLGHALEAAWVESIFLGGQPVDVWRYEGEAQGVIVASVKSTATA